MRHDKMGFDFNPSFWFICRFCRHSFADTETLTEHKLACHLGECVGIKCIVFEERLLTDEWTPDNNLNEDQNQVLNADQVNKGLLKEYKEKAQLDYGLPSESPFKNPYVLLPRIMKQEINLPLNKNVFSNEFQEEMYTTEECIQGSQCFKSKATYKEFGVSEQELQKADQTDNNTVSIATLIDFTGSQNSVFENDMHVQDYTEVEVESPYNDELSETNSLTEEDNESEAEYQKMTSDTEASDFNSNVESENVEIKVDTYDSDSTASGSEILEIDQQPQNQITRNQEQGPQTDKSNQEHQSTTATDEEVANSFKCKTCSSCFCSSERLARHMKCHSPIKPSSRHTCSVCQIEYKRKGDLTRHMVIHGKASNFKCRFCLKFFCENRALRDHERSHTGDRPFKCPVASCKYAAASKGNLVTHTRARHSEELGLEQFLCSACGKTFGLKRRLDVHLWKKHRQ